MGRKPQRHRPTLEGQHPWERGDWLGGVPGSFAAHGAHGAALDEFSAAARACDVIEAEREDRQRDWRERVRNAVEADQPTPDKDYDEAVLTARLELARENVVEQRARLARTACDCLAELRARRRELAGVEVGPVAVAINAGLEGSMDRVKQQLEDRLAALDAGPDIEIIPDEQETADAVTA
jgi:hypothetical protein